MHIRRAAASLALLAALAVPALATSQQHYHRTDAQCERAVREVLDRRALAHVSVRVWHGHVTLGGELPRGDALAALERELVAKAGAVSVHDGR